MELEKRINEELKSATKSGDKIRLETIRSIRARIIEFNKSGTGREMSEDDGMKILLNAAKQRKDAISLYEKGNRMELVEKERQELSVIEEFLPKQIDDNEIKQIIKDIIDKIGATQASDLGKVMGAAMKELKGKADGSKIKDIANTLLGN